MRTASPLLAAASIRLSAPLAAAALLAGCAGPHPRAFPAPVAAAAPTTATPSDALAAFLAATDQRDFAAAWRLLAESQRVRYTPLRLQEDYDAVSALARERLDRARAALVAGPRIEGDRAQFPIGMGRAVVLVREPCGWRVLSLE